MRLAQALALRMGDLGIKTKLMMMMLSLLALSVSTVFVLHYYNEEKLLAQVREYTEELSTAIEIAQAQPAGEGDLQKSLQEYAAKLRRLGVKDVSIADLDNEVQVSTNPGIVGKKVVRSKRKGPHEYVVRGVLGDDPGMPGRTSTLTIPLVAGERIVGYLRVTRYLDDFSELSREAFVNRLIATLAVFAVGILLSLYLSWSFSRPLQQLTQASRQVAAGDLGVEVPPGGADEIGSLSRTFNEMVVRLREHRQLEERLHFAERSTALGRLASAVAHEIRNPLNMINLSIDHIRGRLGPEDQKKRDDFDRILLNMKSEIARLNRLVSDFLSFGKPMRLDKRPCALDSLAREVASLVEHKAKDHAIALTVETDDAVPLLVADPELLKTCLLNLMINAVDAMPEGGQMGLSVRTVGGPAGESIVVTVTDTGHGMTPDAIGAAFEPYFSTKETGLGLGLALTRKIVEDHGGTITLISAPGRGTTATITLPLLAEPRPATAEALVAP